jgi:hypothetical protein
MRRIKLLLIFILALQSCQLIYLEPKKQTKKVFIANQKSARGILNLFLMQIDSNDVYSAIFLRTDTTGKKVIPSKQYDSYYDAFRLQRQINNLPITFFKADTLSEDSILIRVEFDYIRNVEFLASRVDSLWYIADLKSWKEIYSVNALKK